MDPYSFKTQYDGVTGGTARAHMFKIEDRLQVLKLPNKYLYPVEYFIAAKGIFRRSLLGEARDWFNEQEANFETFDQLKKAFLKKFHSAGEGPMDHEREWSRLKLRLPNELGDQGEKVDSFRRRIDEIGDLLDKSPEQRLHAFKTTVQGDGP